jgi:hypothetical protein
MKYLCLGYLEPGTFEGMTEDERHAVLDECFEYNDHLRANGHLVAEVPLQSPETALTLSSKNGKVATTDGPYTETKEQVGGIQILEARDLNDKKERAAAAKGCLAMRPTALIKVATRDADARQERIRTCHSFGI